MSQITYQEAYEILHPAGCTRAEAVRLCQFRRSYRRSELDLAAFERRRLEFVRWLVVTGRLSDELPETKEQGGRKGSVPTHDGVSPRLQWAFPLVRRKG
jgi:hypothetical protein